LLLNELALNGSRFRRQVIELRLQRGEAFGVEVDRAEEFAEQRFDALEPLLDRAVAGGANPVTLIGRLR